MSQISQCAETYTNLLNSYKDAIAGVAGTESWMGPSADNIIAQAESFLDEYNAIAGQLSSCAKACDLLEQYNEAKNYYEQYAAAASSSEGDVSAQNAQYANEYSSQMDSLNEQIAAALQEASSPSLSATSNASSINVSIGIASGDFVNYYQYNYSDPYGGGTIANWGCGPTALAMVLTYLTGNEITPVQTAADGNNGYVCADGTLWTFFPDIAAKYGVNCQQVEPTRDNIVNSLENGTPVIINMGRGTFTNGGHFLVLRGLDENGKVIIADPASESRSNTTWDLDIFTAETNGGMWTFSV